MKKYLKNLFDAENPAFVTAVDELALWSAPFGMTLLETVKLKSGIKALDIGCGTGFPLLELAGRLNEKSNITGIDPWSNAIERVKEKISLYEITNAEALVASAENLPFENNFFDLIVSNNGINNVQDLDKTLSECYRTLKPGGQFVFTFNLPESLKEFYDVFESVLFDLGLLSEIQNMHEHIFDKRKPIDFMEKAVTNSGLKTKEIIKKQFQYKFTNGNTFFCYPMIRFHFLPSWKEILPPQRVEEIFQLTENKLDEIVSKEKELVMTIPYVCFDVRK
jgi:ubiquinone/menaquinone biosynthesis C-methylase UbiE